MNDWIGIEENNNAVGFVYKITEISTGKYYIGKKSLSKTKTTKGKFKNGNTKKIKTVVDSDWKRYFGSSIEFKGYVKEKGEKSFKREILRYCTSKKNLSYWENWYLYTLNVLTDDLSFNKNISGSFFKKDV